MTPEGVLVEAMLTIANKQGEDVPFILNPTQRDIDETLTGRDIYPKARQEGVSSYFLGRNTVKCLTRRNHRAVVVSHEAKATERMLLKVHYFLNHMQPRPVIGHSSKNTITFPKLDSMYYIGTAGSTEFGRGDTINSLHCSEAAFWPDAKTLMTGLMQAVPRSGEVSVESTGNGQGNHYHKMCVDARVGRSHYALHFYNFQDFDEYNLELSPEEEDAIRQSLDPDLEEPKRVEQYNLTMGQIKFRRERLAELEWDLDAFAQEYPMSFDECFMASGRGLFKIVRYIKTDEWRRVSDCLWMLDGHPSNNNQYVIGSDVSGGVGEDRSVAEIFCLGTMEQVGEYVSDSEQPNDFGVTLAALGAQYNNAFITVEANNYGVSTLDALIEIYPSDLVYHETKRIKSSNEYQLLTMLGFRTTQMNKPFVLGKLRTHLKEHIVIHSEGLKEELSTYVEKRSVNNNPILGAESGCFDDRVMATAMITVGLDFVPESDQPRPEPKLRIKDPFTLDAMIDELRGKNGNFPIPTQVW